MSSRLFQEEVGEVSSPIPVTQVNYDCQQFDRIREVIGSEIILQKKSGEESKNSKSTVSEEHKKADDIKQKPKKIRKNIKLKPFLSVLDTELSVRMINELLGCK